MAHTAACPSCGAPVEFRLAVSILAVCEYCQSTLLRSGEGLEDLGKMAALVEDRSPLQLGSEGRWQGRHFALIGRIQMRYEAGIWNEWHLLFDDGRAGWLSEASGEFVLSQLKWVPDVLPTFDTAVAGDQVLIDGTGFTVTNVLKAECVGGAGELPFKVGAGYPAPLVDLRAADRFATIDYSEGKPMLFVGQVVPFADFNWANLREGIPLPQVDAKATALSCPNCGSPVEVHSDAVETVACRHCGSVSDIYAGKLKLWARAKGVLEAAPWLPLDSRGTLRGTEVTVIGALVRSTTIAGVRYDWREYLLLTGKRGFLWLTETDGHWVLARVLSSPPNASKSNRSAPVFHGGKRFEHFQNAKATVEYVIGEFNWKVRVGEEAEVDDYVCVPSMLSREWSREELVWSIGEYVEPQEIVAAFGKALPPARVGVGACQPSPVAERHRTVCRRYWQFAAIAIVIQLASVFFTGGQSLLRQDVALTGGQDDPSLTREFRVDRPTKLTVRNRTGVVNNWVALELALVDTRSGLARVEHREVSYYHGVDSDGSWSEGSPDDTVVFGAVAPGTYRLALVPEMAPGATWTIADTVEVVAGETIWSNIILFLIATGLFPLFTRWRAAAFEARRWEESDHPRSGEDDD